MKTSLYNWMIAYNNNVIVYNGYTGALATILKENVAYINDVMEIEPGKCCDSLASSIPESLFKDLYDSGFILDDNRDELEEMRVLYNLQKYSSYLHGITAVVTTYCNFACTYCYEGSSTNKSDYMRTPVIDAIADTAQKAGGKQFHLALYGGEPLVAFDSCIELLEKVNKSVTGNGMKFKSSIVTNGYLLCADVANHLLRLGVTEAQITLDGTRRVHDSRRVLRNGDGTYDTILQNILGSPDEMVIKVRVNIDKNISNTEDYRRLVEEINKKTNVSLHPAPTRYDHEGIHNIGDDNQEYIDKCYPEYLVRDRLNARVLGCVASTYRGMVVMPDGNILKCWNEVGLNRSYGNVRENYLPSIHESIKWMKWNPYDSNSICGSCKKLPQCCGGCPMEYVEGRSPKCRYPDDKSFENYIIANYKHLVESQ